MMPGPVKRGGFKLIANCCKKSANVLESAEERVDCLNYSK